MASKDQYGRIMLCDILYIILLKPKENLHVHNTSHGTLNTKHILKVQSDSKLLSGFPFAGHGNHDNNLESSCIFPVKVDTCDNIERT
jgi:hypothetical protein